MPLYNESTTTETKEITTYDRAYRIEVINPKEGKKTIRYDEETITTVTQDGISTDVGQSTKGNLTKELTVDNASTPFALLSPITSEPLGDTATYADLQVLLYSLYFHLATERDNA